MSPLEKLVLSAGAGLGLLGLLILAIGLLGGLQRWLGWGLLALGVVLAYRRAMPLLNEVWASEFKLPSGRLYAFLVLFLGLRLLLALVQALTPPTAWDSLVYHLTGPKLYVGAGRILPGIDIPYLGFPALMEMLYTAGSLLKGPQVTQLLHWSFTVLALALVYVFARRHFDSRVGWLSMALLYGVPTLALISAWAYVDLTLVYYELAAVHVFLRWRESGDRRWLAGAGLFCGLAMGTKYTAVGLAVALGLLVIGNVGARGWRRTAGDILLLGAVASAVTLPWLLKNWAFTGNPVYPFLFDGLHWDAFRRFWYSRSGTGLAYSAPWRLITAPWEMTVLAAEGKEGFSATIGPLLLAGLPILALLWRHITEGEKRVLVALGLVSLVQYLIWLAGVASSALLAQTRLLFPIFALLALMAGFALDRVRLLRRPAFAIDWVVSVVVALSLCLELLSVGLGFVRDNPLPYIAGWESRASYLERHLGLYYNAVDYINRELPDGARVLFWWEPRSYYCQRDCQPDAILDGFKYLTHRFGSAARIAAYLREQGYTHVLLFQQGLDYVLESKFDPIDENDLAALQELKQDYLQPVYGDGQPYILYRVKDST